MNEKLIFLTRDYLKTTEEAKNIMLEAFALKTKNDLIDLRARIPGATFWFAGMVHTYAFHGVGFRFSNEYGEGVNIEKINRKPIRIDMELGYGDFWCGISPWMFYKFIEEYYPDLKNQFDTDAIKKEFDIGIKEKLLYKKYNLYYLN